MWKQVFLLREPRKDLHIVFIDMEKAYSFCLYREHMIEYLERLCGKFNG